MKENCYKYNRERSITKICTFIAAASRDLTSLKAEVYELNGGPIH